MVIGEKKGGVQENINGKGIKKSRADKPGTASV